MLVFIVGYMGAGKSSVGAALAKALNFRFVDTDDWIEARCCKTITQIFNDLGWILNPFGMDFDRLWTDL